MSRRCRVPIQIALHRAFTLVEILIGVGLLVVLLGIFLTIMRGGSSESRLSSDHFTSAMLSQKVVENMIEEVDLNPWGMEALGIEESSPLTLSPIVDGATVFFKSVEDRRPPWGKIDGQSEGIIDSTYAPLYFQVRPFRVSASGKRLSFDTSTPEHQHLISAGVEMNWDTKIGAGKTDAGCHLFSPIGPKPATISFLIDPQQLERDIAYHFFNSPGEPVPQLVAESGADYQTITHLGRLYTGTSGFLNSPVLQKHLDEVALRKTKASGPFGSKLDEYKAWQNLGSACFDLAGLCFAATYVMATDARSLENACSPTQVGDALADDPDPFLAGLRNYLKIVKTHSEACRMAIHAYRKLLNPDLSGARGVKQQMFVICRLLDLYRVLAADTANSSALSQYRTFLEDLRKETDGRNQHLNRLLVQEKDLAQSSADLIRQHGFLQPIDLVTGKAVPVVQGIIAQYAATAGK